MFRMFNLNKKGMALLTVLLFFFVLILLLGGITQFTITNLSNSRTSNLHTTAYYTAESGVNVLSEDFLAMVEEANTNHDDASTFQTRLTTWISTADATSQNLGSSLGAVNRYTINVTTQPDVTVDGITYHVLRIESIGTVGDISRTVFQDVRYLHTLDKSLGAVATLGSITIGSNFTVEGGMATNGTVIEIKNPGSCSEITSITVPVGTNLNKVDVCARAKVITTSEPIVFPSKFLPEFNPVLTFNLNTYNGGSILDMSTDPGANKGYQVANLNPTTSTLTIKLGNWTPTQEFKVLNVTGSVTLPSKIVLEGTGRLLIMTKQSTLNIGNFTLEPEDPLRFNIAIDKTNAIINFNMNGLFVGSLFTNSTQQINYKQTNQYGYLITAATDIKPNPTKETDYGLIVKSGDMGLPTKPIVIYAPNASIIMKSGTHIYGSVMSKTFSGSTGDSFVTYDGALFEKNPDPFFWLDLPTIIGDFTVEFGIDTIWEK